MSPAPWTPAERRHRRLEAIWRSLRSDLDADVPWARHVAWAEPDGEHVVLSLVTRHPGEPARYDERTAQRLDPEDVEAVAEAMEALREEAAEREAQAREAWHAQAAEADRLRHAQALRAIDAAGRAELDRRDAQLRREVAEQERAERRAQARAVAEALRRP